MSAAPTTPTPEDPALYESRAGVPIAVVSTVLAISTAAVGLRSYCRAVIVRQFGIDDWAAVAALLLAIGSGITIAAGTMYGSGRHMKALDPTEIYKYFRAFYVSIVLYNASLTATKLTFLLQYYRILGTGPMKRAIIAAFVIVALWSTSQLLVNIFQCTPIHRFWVPDIPGTCIPPLPFWYINAAGNIVTDIIVFIIPLPALSRLNLRRGQKFALVGVFSLGFFTCAISVIRIQYLHLSEDVTWDNVGASCWSIGEVCSGITCACLPTLRPLIPRWFPFMGLQAWQSDPSRHYYHKSSDRDKSSATGNGGNVPDNGSTRAIIYPEDLELQTVDRLEKGSWATRAELDQVEPSHQKHGKIANKSGLGLKPTVTTEIRVGPRASDSGSSTGSGIRVKRDFIMTKESN